MEFNETKFNECFDNTASPMVLHGGVPVVTREGAVIMVKEYLDAVKQDEPESISEPRSPTVAGRHLRGSNSEFEQACLVHIQRLQENIGDYDCAMLDTFCEAVRMFREYSDVMQVLANSPLRKCPICGEEDEPDLHACSSCGHNLYGEEA